MSGAVKREVAGIALLLLAVFIAGTLLFQPLAEGTSVGGCGDARGLFGPVGACLKSAVLTLLGGAAAALLPLVPAVHGLRLLRRLDTTTDRSWMIFLAGVVVLLPIGVGLASGTPRAAGGSGGLWGYFTAFYLARAFGTAGAWIVLALAASALMAITLRWNPIRAVIGSGGPGAAKPKTVAPTRASLLEPPPEELPAMQKPPPELANADVAASSVPGSSADAKRRASKKPRQPVAGVATAEDPSPELPIGEPEGNVYEDLLPSSELLTAAPSDGVDPGRRELETMGEKLMEALRTFRVEGELVGRTTGPVVTQFEIEPAPGVKVRQFANLANDLALAMRAQSIRVVAPIPGRGAVGVEVPNPVADIVWFRELIEAREFQAGRHALPIALGRDLEGKTVVADLAKMPHLLIAGATGSGKSVCVNTIITSLVYRHTPKTLRFLMIDPKMVELTVYNTLPHLRYRVITDNRDAASLLKWAVLEMQERYQLLAANGVRNVQEFNKRVQDGATLQTPKQGDVAFEDRTYRGGLLPYLVIVIDELADLMMTVQGEVEHPLAMLAQKARAIGIHLILATQRPSVNVITGLIKANFPSRIAFRVASQIDSRTIIDGMGAEALLGNGDMLFIPPGKSEPQRIQGAFISGEDTERLMKWYAAQREARRRAIAATGQISEEPAAEPDPLEMVRSREAMDAAGGDDEGGMDDADRDKLFREAAEVCIQHQQGSTSLLQRRLGIGYGRAARIIDQLHAAGVLGPPNASKPRDVLMGLEDLDRIAGPRT